MKHIPEEIILKELLNTIHTPEYDIMASIRGQVTSSHKPFNYKSVIYSAIVLLLTFVLTIGAAAAVIPSFNDLLAAISPEIASRLQYINASSMYNGIKMEVMAALNDDEMAVIYIKMQDLEGNRLSQDLDLYNYSFSGGRMFNSQVVHYDEVSGTAILRLQLNGGEELNGRLMRFRVRSFLTNKKSFEGIDTGISLKSLMGAEAPETINLNMNNIPGGGGDLYQEYKDRGTIVVLKPKEAGVGLPDLNFVEISNIGLIENRLHIQARWTGGGIDDHGYFYLVDAAGKPLETSSGSILFGIDQEGSTTYGREFQENIIDVTDINLEEVRLMGYFVTNEKYIEGNWRVSFKMVSQNQQITRECSLQLKDLLIDTIALSPLGITLTGKGSAAEVGNIDIRANTYDGEEVYFDAIRTLNDAEKIIVKFSSSLPVDIDAIKSVEINGNEISLD